MAEPSQAARVLRAAVQRLRTAEELLADHRAFGCGVEEGGRCEVAHQLELAQPRLCELTNR